MIEPTWKITAQLVNKFLSKVFEKLLYQRMISFCERNQLFTSAQFGFRSTKSCADAIMLVTEYMRDEIDKKSSGQACFIDLQKAFDTLDQDILLTKLYEYGFRGEVNILLRSYLSDRVQYISISGETTSCQKTETSRVYSRAIIVSTLYQRYNEMRYQLQDSTFCRRHQDFENKSEKRYGYSTRCKRVNQLVHCE